MNVFHRYSSVSFKIMQPTEPEILIIQHGFWLSVNPIIKEIGFETPINST